MRNSIATHADGEWTRRSVEFHLKRAEEHLKLLREDEQLEDHLAHAATRLLMALTLREIGWLRVFNSLLLGPSSHQ
jgi:uncharacterized membrane-anchored protein YhcB (DUF1043 family)